MQIKDLGKMIRGWQQNRKRKALAQRLLEIKRTFQVTELDGTLYLTCNGIPYKEVPANETSGQITGRLGDTRKAMRSYLGEKETQGVKPDTRLCTF